MLWLAPQLCSAYAAGSRQAVSPRRCDAPRCSLLADLATAPLLSDLASSPLLPGAAVLVAASAAGAVLATRPTGPVGAPYPADAKGYDPAAADAFYGARPLVVASRLLRLGSITLAFNVRLGLDYLAYKRAGAPEDESWPNEADRAKEALALATQLGPTFIKLAQALTRSRSRTLTRTRTLTLAIALILILTLTLALTLTLTLTPGAVDSDRPDPRGVRARAAPAAGRRARLRLGRGAR